jgi:hypothetical protein
MGKDVFHILRRGRNILPVHLYLSQRHRLKRNFIVPL